MTVTMRFAAIVGRELCSATGSGGITSTVSIGGGDRAEIEACFQVCQQNHPPMINPRVTTAVEAGRGRIARIMLTETGGFQRLFKLGASVG